MSSWKSTLAAIAPTLATALGGPLAGAAVQAIGKSLLGEGKFDEATISNAIAMATPEQLVTLKEVDNKFKTTMKELDIKDRGSARNLALNTSILPQSLLSIIYSGGYFWLLFAFVSGDVTINEDIKSEFNMVLGVLTAAQIQIMNFWFGSSSGSKDKTSKLK